MKEKFKVFSNYVDSASLIIGRFIIIPLLLALFFMILRSLLKGFSAPIESIDLCNSFLSLISVYFKFILSIFKAFVKFFKIDA